MADTHPPQPPPGESREEILRRSGKYLGIGSSFVASILACTVGGWWLDRRLGTLPWLTLVGAIVGIAVGFYLFFRLVLPKEGHLGEWFE